MSAPARSTGRPTDGAVARSSERLYATILTVGCMVSRGLAKSGSQEPYDDDAHRAAR